MNIPNTLSLTRILLIPFIAIFLIQGYIKISLILFIVSSITDFLDGFFARRLQQFTDLGKLLDPLCVKLLILCLFSVFLCIDTIPLWYYLTLLIKECISILAYFQIRGIHNPMDISPTRASKWLTFVNMVIIILVYLTKLNFQLFVSLKPLFILSFLLSIYTFIQYSNLWIMLIEKHEQNHS